MLYFYVNKKLMVVRINQIYVKYTNYHYDKFVDIQEKECSATI